MGCPLPGPFSTLPFSIVADAPLYTKMPSPWKSATTTSVRLSLEPAPPTWMHASHLDLVALAVPISYIRLVNDLDAFDANGADGAISRDGDLRPGNVFSVVVNMEAPAYVNFTGASKDAQTKPSTIRGEQAATTKAWLGAITARIISTIDWSLNTGASTPSRAASRRW